MGLRDADSNKSLNKPSIRGSKGVSKSEAVRARLNHPIIDGDGHTVESMPVLLEFLNRVAGPDMVAQYTAHCDLPWYHMTPQQRFDQHVPRPNWWTRPTLNTLDRATSMLPRLRRDRMDELGTDFSVIYPSLGLHIVGAADDDMRRAVCRAMNEMHADIFGSYADRMTPAAVIPMHTPDEAIEELEYCVKELGMKAAMIASHVLRPVPDAARSNSAQSGPVARWVDNLALSSAYDYDRVWAKCMELKIAPTGHSLSMGWGSRGNIDNFMYNHIGHFAASGELFCKALFIGGVTRRFPDLKFGFLEGGAAWACTLLSDLVSHWKKRNPEALAMVDPANLDQERMRELFFEYGAEMVSSISEDSVVQSIADLGGNKDGLDPSSNGKRVAIDDFAACGIKTVQDIHDLFVPNFYFGCEADDPTTKWAFSGEPKLKALFSSDVGHWDVEDMSECVAEAFEMVEDGLISEEDFRDFTFTNSAMLHAGMNPDFFKGTVLEADVEKLLAAG